ncbi:hypothetical protein COO60DRAFT_1546013 [Scenedesmus sp. NREL 46B-D3]|nr:hypothetical protein COO60DRAFT_1546013 [Scenedesmus sp. NREL 46B-D3]
MQRVRQLAHATPTHSYEATKCFSKRLPRPFRLRSSAGAQQDLQDAISEAEANRSTNSRYGRITKMLAACSVVPALILAVQPLVAGGCAGAAGIVEWQGPLRDMFSFTVLLSVFIGCEPGAAAASAVSAAGACLMLFSGPASPPWVACCTAAALAASATMVLATACVASSSSSSSSSGGGSISRGSGDGSSTRRVGRFNWRPQRMLQGVQRALGVLGGGLLAQYFSSLGDSSAAAGMQWLAPVTVGALAVLLAGRLVAAAEDKQLQLLWADWPAWSATLLLILQPLQQLVESSFQPLQMLPGLCASQQLLLVLASGLMVPRALLQRELMWFTGTCSGSLLAAGQLGVLAVHHCVGGQLQHGLGSNAAVSAAAGAGAAQLQLWASRAASLEPCGRAAATITAMCLALLVTCMVLQSGWLYIEGGRPPEAGF